MSPGRPDRFTLVSFHAHPDDEVLLTGGLLARAAAEGHRVVLVTATAGERGLAGTEDGAGADLARRRSAELAESARLLGCDRVVELGYRDSGLRPDPDDTDAFAHQDVDAVARSLAVLLREEQADVLTIYDRNGGYGHPDHQQVHRAGTLAARLAGTPGGPGGDGARSPVRSGAPAPRARRPPPRTLGAAGHHRRLRQPRRDHPPGRRRVGARPQACGDGRTRVAAAWRPDHDAPSTASCGCRDRCSGWSSAVSGTSSRADPAPHASTTCSHRYGARRRTRTTLCSCTPPTMEI